MDSLVLGQPKNLLHRKELSDPGRLKAALRAEIERLREVLAKITALDPDVDSEEGMNEWGEADCFNKAQQIARAALVGDKP